MVFSLDSMRIPSIGDVLNNFDLTANTVIGKFDVVDHDSQRTIASFSSFAGWSRNRSSSVPTQAVEKGSFAAYNKTVNPIEFTCTLVKSGMPYELQAYDNALNEYWKSVKLVDIILPVGTFIGYNITDLQDGMSEGESSTILAVQMTLKEIKEQKQEYGGFGKDWSSLINPADSSIVSKGKQAVNSVKGSLLSRISSFF